jgi:hypothetical protein
VEDENRGLPMPLGRYYLQQIPMVYKGLAGWLTSGDYSIRGDKRVYLVKLPTNRHIDT